MSSSTIRYDAPDTIGSSSLDRCIEKVDTSSEEDCPICMCPLDGDSVVKLSDCGHMYHKECLEQAVARAPKCPICRVPVGDPQGHCPSGTMSVHVCSQRCASFESYRTIQISYQMNNGTQKSYHPNPGTSFTGAHRMAYLPNNEDGKNLLKRLKYAWRHGLSFTVGTSLTTGASNVVVWSSIHHKTSLAGGVHGFPDPGYFTNCNTELDGLAVPASEDLADDGEVLHRKRPYRPSSNDDNNEEEEARASAAATRSSSRATRSSGRRSARMSASARTTATSAATISTTAAIASATALAKKSTSKAKGPDATGICEIIQYTAPKSLSNGAVIHGTCPSGTMTITTSSNSLPGYQHTNKFILSYDIPDGTQQVYHPNPGASFTGTIRSSYVPNTKEGQELVMRLKCAWKRGLCLSVGTSMTTGESDVVVWSTIPHKTHRTGGAQRFGYPDPAYIAACNQELDNCGVPKASGLLPSGDTRRGGRRGIWTRSRSFKRVSEKVLYTAPPRLSNGQGTSPSGEMQIDSAPQKCGGFEGTSHSTIRVTYVLQSGSQKQYHPNFGVSFQGVTRVAYLPENDEGRDLLKRLKAAWQKGLCFSVGKSQATGRDNSVVWSTIPHKTSLSGGPGVFGYPDASYLATCHAELTRLGVPPAAQCK